MVWYVISTIVLCFSLRLLKFEFYCVVLMYINMYHTIQAAYTFDAGPNAVIYALEKDIPEIIALVSTFFPAGDDVDVSVAVVVSMLYTRILPHTLLLSI